MKKLAIFDFDGTLVNSVNDVIICFNKALTKHNPPTLTQKEYYNRLGGNIDQMISQILKNKNTQKNITQIKNTYLNLYYNSKKENTQPYPKAHETLIKLQNKNIKIAINSNRYTDSLESFTNKFFPDIKFISIEGHNTENPSKPSPIGVNKILKKAQILPKETIYIGDSKTDIETAKNAGIDCIIVKWGYGNKNDWENKHIIDCIDNFSQILKYF